MSGTLLDAELASGCLKEAIAALTEHGFAIVAELRKQGGEWPPEAQAQLERDLDKLEKRITAELQERLALLARAHKEGNA